MARSKPHWPSQKPLLTGKPPPSQVAPPSTDRWTVPFASAVPARTVTVAPTLLIASLLSVLMAVANVRVKVGDTLPPTAAVPALGVRQIPLLAATLEWIPTSRLLELPGSNSTSVPHVVMSVPDGVLATSENVGVTPSAVLLK